MACHDVHPVEDEIRASRSFPHCRNPEVLRVETEGAPAEDKSESLRPILSK